MSVFVPIISSSSNNVVIEEVSKYKGASVTCALSIQIKFNLSACLLILVLVGSFVQIMLKLGPLMGIRGGLSWDRKNLEYQCHKKQCERQDNSRARCKNNVHSAKSAAC